MLDEIMYPFSIHSMLNYWL